MITIKWCEILSIVKYEKLLNLKDFVINEGYKLFNPEF